MLSHTVGHQPPSALQYGLFAQAAYDVYAAQPSNLNPSQSDYPSFPAGYSLILNIQMTDFFEHTTTQRHYGFMAQSIAEPTAFVTAFRGTDDMEEWWDDFHWEPVPFPYMPGGGNVAAGFLDIYKTFSVTLPGSPNAPAKLTDKLSLPGQIDLRGRSVSLVAVGHSLGAALITLYAADVASGGWLNPTVYTLASPRVGDIKFAAAYNSTIATNYRIWNWPDIVPRFPKDPFDNYKHVKGGFEVDSLEHSEVKLSLECFHYSQTYLFLLGGPASALGMCTA